MANKKVIVNALKGAGLQVLDNSGRINLVGDTMEAKLLQEYDKNFIVIYLGAGDPAENDEVVANAVKVMKHLDKLNEKPEIGHTVADNASVPPADLIADGIFSRKKKKRKKTE